MAVSDLEDQLRVLNLAGADYLLFHPPSNGECNDDTPRYLFRVFTEYSQGSTGMHWAKSMDAENAPADGRVDIFSKHKNRAAELINKHLRNEKCTEDNLISWTSSLLNALVYIFHLRAKDNHDVTFDQIHLCVVDTSSIPKGVFLRDLDLIGAYRQYHSGYNDLNNLEYLRCTHEIPGSSSRFYFGEYLSQGALKIEGHCQIVSAKDIIDRGLYNIRSEFKEYAAWKRQLSPPWANAVIEMRKSFYRDISKQQMIGYITLQSALDIADVFGPRWKLPIAAHLVALAAPQIGRGIMLAKFRTLPDGDRQECSPSRTKIAAYPTLPEVQEYEIIMQSIYRDYCFNKFNNSLREAEDSLHLAATLTEEIFTIKQGFASSDFSWGPTLHQLYTIISLSGTLRNDLISKLQRNSSNEDGEENEDNETEEDSEKDEANLTEA